MWCGAPSDHLHITLGHSYTTFERGGKRFRRDECLMTNRWRESEMVNVDAYPT